MKQLIIGALACLIAAMSWGAMFPVADHALTYIDPFYFSTIRYGSVTILLLILLAFKEGIQAFRFEGKTKHLLFFGVMAFTVYNILIFLGQMLMGQDGVMVASIMETIMPVITALLAWLIYKNRPKNYMLISMAIAFLGASLVITKGDFTFFSTLRTNSIPLLFIFIGVTGWVIYTMGGQYFKGWSTLRYSTLTCAVGTGVTTIMTCALTLQGSIAVPTIATLQIIKYDMLFMILLPGLIALLAWNYGIKILTSLNGILFINAVPLTTLAIMLLQGYKITAYDIAGTLLVIGALVGNNLYQRHERHLKMRLKHEVPIL